MSPSCRRASLHSFFVMHVLGCRTASFRRGVRAAVGIILILLAANKLKLLRCKERKFLKLKQAIHNGIMIIQFLLILLAAVENEDAVLDRFIACWGRVLLAALGDIFRALYCLKWGSWCLASRPTHFAD